MDEFLDRMDGRPVHHLHAGRNDPGADDAADAGARVLRRSGKPISMRARGFRLLQDAHRDLGDDAEQALRADDDAEQIVAAGVEMLAAQPDDLAGHQHDLAAEHVVAWSRRI